MKVVIAIILMGVLVAACTVPTPPDATPASRMFRFASGGAYHPQGYGEWTVQVNEDGRLQIGHQVGDNLQEFGPYTLSAEENAGLWTLIDKAALPERKSSERPGVPDEAQYTFVLTRDGTSHTVKLWVGDAWEEATLVQLVTRLGEIITAYTGQTPVLR
ncbi:MAG: hypothetical protein D6791_04720 [Chloroflexi bacterium]|nr:MAG: hypothetical protein D6791_04720 [Chloroflexota bacterium]